MLTTYIIVAVIAYLLGSIPFGYILLRIFRGEDVRASGSGNIGATNVARKAPGLGLLTLLLDAIKGAAAVFLAQVIWIHFVPGGAGFWLAAEAQLRAGEPPSMAVMPYQIGALAALFAVIGHMYPIWLRFQGGKGVATGLGAFALLVPRAILLVVLAFLLVVAVWRYVSLGSIAAAVAFPIAAYFLHPFARFPEALGAICAASALIVLKHHANIRRLLAGTEHRFELKRTRA